MTNSSLHAPALGQLSNALQTLHRQLLEHQAYQSGFVGSPLDLFARASTDEAFAWLKPLRESIVALDERRADDTPLTDEETKNLGSSVRRLIEADSGPFRDNLNAAFQADPETIWALSCARSAARSLGADNLERAA